MSDFDKILNDRLNEDDGELFPRREANWEKLTERLTGFEAANPLPKDVPVLRPVWRRWALAGAAAAVIGIGGLLMWQFNEVKNMQLANASLQQEVAALKAEQQTGNATAKGNQSVNAQTDAKAKVNQPESKDLNKTNVVQNQKMTNSTPSVSAPVFEQKQVKNTENGQNNAVVETKLNKSKQEVVKKPTITEGGIQKRNNSQIVQVEKQKMLENVPFDKIQEPLKGQKTQLKEAVALQTDPSVSESKKADLVENKPLETNIAPKTGDESIKTDKKDIDKIETVAQNTATQNTESATTTPSNSKVKDNAETAKTEGSAITKEDKNLVAETSNATPPIVKTDNAWKRIQKVLSLGFAVGLNGTGASAMPEIPGLRATTGKGASATLMLTKNIGLVVQGDLLETHFEMRERPKRFHLPDAPDPKKPNVGLHHIKGEQHSGMLSINAKYVFGEKWWVQPFVTAGHSWLKTDEHDVNFVFRDLTTGEETPSQTKVSTEKNKNLWQVGVGVEKKIRRWSFGVSAELQKDFSKSADPNSKFIASNFGILRGGVKYNIF
jgi:hypothetical protein